ncbi:MAG: hypothetical protein JXQ90_23685 [Cyclobacteriaceae bacterium]
MKDKAISNTGSMGSCMYFIGFIGASTYFINTAVGFWMGALGVLKAMVWPAFLVYDAFVALGS